MRLRGSNLAAEKLCKLATINHTIVVCVNAVEHYRRHLLSFSHCRKQVGMRLFRESRELADSNYMRGCAQQHKTATSVQPANQFVEQIVI